MAEVEIENEAELTRVKSKGSDGGDPIPLISALIGGGIEHGLPSAVTALLRMLAQGMVEPTKRMVITMKAELAKQVPPLPEPLRGILADSADEVLALFRHEGGQEEEAAAAGAVEKVVTIIVAIAAWLAMVDLIHICFRWMQSKMDVPPGGWSFEDAKRTIVEYFEWMIGITTMSHLIAQMAEGITEGKLRGIRRLCTDLVFALGLPWLTWMVGSIPLQAAIADPYRREYYRRVRPNQAPRTEWEEGIRRGRVSVEEYRERMANEGYDDASIELMLGNLEPLLTEAQARDMYRRGIWDKARVEEEIAKRGYRGDRLMALVDRAIDDAKEAYRREALSEVELNYALGYMDEKAAVDNAKYLGLNDEAIPYWLFQIRLRRERELKQLRERLLEEEVEKGVKTIEDYMAELSEFVVFPERVLLKADYLQRRLLPKERRVPVETLEERRRRVENKVKLLEEELDYLLRAKEEQMKAYLGRIERLEAQLPYVPEDERRRIEERIRRLQEEMEEDKLRYEHRIREVQTRLAEAREELEGIYTALGMTI
ncbi:MAG: hypothetical protein DRJ18_00655 [Candidatus Methanomethylicota archaeon]|nr:MAG: hypothetical protein DRJ18_00655 [Candidatus Verstraetearchaeota archaeon]